MNKQQAQQIIRDTFENPFDKQRFTKFILNFLNHFEEDTFIHRGYNIPDSYDEYISSWQRLGKFSDGKNRIDILIVNLKKETSLEQARSRQRNFVAGYLQGKYGRSSEKKAALVAYVSPNKTDWRFSLVKMDISPKPRKDKTPKLVDEFTPARRWSFLVGANEKSHTAQSRLVNILANDEQAPTLKEIEKAFDIETVTKEFFLKYRELFLDAKKELDEIVEKDEKIKTDFIRNEVSTIDFCKKLLGQIVFLYFLQKKGWFGVKRGKEWGTGSKHFLRELFQKKHGTYKNFFNDILEPLFYNTLAVERPKDYSDRFDCKIPFLNGGLFDPINNYDWIETEIYLPDELFSNNIKTKDGDIGTGILDVFDRYNFTVKEDEPLEKEVAIDPEMLGKVFENLLEVKDRKSKGTYYTPREIVHYMCQESLINYLSACLAQAGLATELSECHSRDLLGGNPAPLKEDIEALIKFGETAVEHDMRVVSKGKETETYSFKLPENIRDHAGLIDEKLANIRVCDPAIGSGAFPLGMMSEIIRARNALTTYLGDEENRTMYNFKRHAIHNCLYGVDIDPGAVEIAKLRLWLSLMVDEEDIKHIKPLPNLDYKIMQGNSLLEEFESIKLFDEKLISSKPFDETRIKEIKEKQSKLQKEFIDLHNRGKLTKAKRTHIEAEQSKMSAILKKMTAPKKDSGQERMVYEVRAGEIAEKLKKLHEEFFEAYHINKKVQLKEQIDELQWKLIETTLKEHKNEDALSKIEQFKRSNIKPFFLWKLNFREVFQEKGGFDVVIANPPYVRQEAIKEIKPQLKKEFGDFYCGTADIYTYFYKLGIDIIRDKAHLCFIAPNKFMRAGYGRKTRELLSREVAPLTVIDFCDLPIFDATTYPSILLLEKRTPADGDKTLAATFTDAEQLEHLNKTLNEISFTMPVKALKSEGWNLERPEVLALMEKLRKAGTPLDEYVMGRFYYGIKTGLNEAFVIDKQTRERLIAEDPKSEELIKPWLRGRDIKKWKAEWAGLYVIFARRGVDINNYPAIKKHLEHFREDLEPKKSSHQKRGRKPGSYNWFDIQDNIAYHKEFEQPKIIWGNLATKPKFAFDPTSNYVSAPANIIPTTDIFLLAVLNSPICRWWITLQAAVRAGGFLEYKPMYVGTVPVLSASDEQKTPVNRHIQTILVTPDSPDIPRLEKEIDNLIYKLYNLTPEEIGIVEGRKL